MKKYFNRELSWIEFNRRVLLEGIKPAVPLLERLKFMAIVSSNFDEFFMVRAASVKSSLKKNEKKICPSGIAPGELYDRIHSSVHEITGTQYGVFNSEIRPGLAEHGIRHIPPEEADSRQRADLEHYFSKFLFPILSAVRIEESSGIFFSGLTDHVAFLLRERESGVKKAAIVPVPANQDRFFRHQTKGKGYRYTLIEEIIAEFGAPLFAGYEIEEYLFFRITREADMGVDEQRDEDFVQAMEEILESRIQSPPIRLEYCGNEGELLTTVQKAAGVEEREIYRINGPLNLKDFFTLTTVSGYEDLKYPEWSQARLDLEGEEIFSAVRDRDILLHHPYHSFDTVEKMLKFAADDPDVMSIKMTLYRTSGDSPIIDALLSAALRGKHVTVLVELKARFDEEQNIQWAAKLEKAGVIVIYGIAHLKVHAKIMMIVRNEYEGIRRYIHLSTGNYNGSTAKLYTDMGLLTSNEQIADEVTKVMNAITGYANIPGLTKLAMAPVSLKNKFLQLINREAEKHTPQLPGRIRAKMNSLSDPEIIKALYKASGAGVHIQLNIRGICMLKPGVPGLSENIEVVSIIDRYLEHTRAFHFYNAGEEEVYLSSADWMPRNLERRVELMFPVEEAKPKRTVIESLDIYFRDNQNAHILNSDGSYTPRQAAGKEKPVRAQELFHKKVQNKEPVTPAPRRTFTVRRNPDKEPGRK